MSNLYAISVVGCDEPGIVASISKVLLELECNLADTSMSVLNGHFAMILIAEGPENGQLELERLRQGIAAATRRFELTISVQPLRESRWPRYFAPEKVAPFERDAVMVTVYGADRPGIVCHVTEAIALTQSNIVDLRTQQSGEQGAPGRSRLYSLFMEVELSRGATSEILEHALAPVVRQFGVQVSVQNLSAAEL